MRKFDEEKKKKMKRNEQEKKYRRISEICYAQRKQTDSLTKTKNEMHSNLTTLLVAKPKLCKSNQLERYIFNNDARIETKELQYKPTERIEKYLFFPLLYFSIICLLRFAIERNVFL